jgi:hypothetical protein
MSLNTLKIARRLQEAGMPAQQSEAFAIILDEEVRSDLVTSAELDAAVDRLEAKLASRADLAAMRADLDKLAVTTRADLETAVARMEATMLRNNVGLLLGVLAIGGFLIRFLR